jgi:hypothetical protein
MNTSVNYSVEQFSEDALTVSIQANILEKFKIVYDLRIKSDSKKILKNTNSKLQRHIESLYSLGFDYIDIGTHSNWIAAEIPFSNFPSEEKFKKAARLLKEISIAV